MKSSPQKPAAKLFPLRTIIPLPSTRIFILGSTGSGKSTLQSVMLEGYHQLFPRHRIYIVDPKKRFYPQPEKNQNRLFPDGSLSRVIKNRIMVPINANLIHDVDGFNYDDEWAWLVQDHQKTIELMDWLYAHPNAKRPAVIAFDESFDFVPGARAHPSLRRLMQQGRELSVGVWITNQRPAWIDQTMFSETNRLYLGRLFHVKDRERMVDHAPFASVQKCRELLVPMPEHEWYLINKDKPQRSFKFRLSRSLAA